MTLLKKHHYEADAVYDGAEALAYLQTGNYDAAILDKMCIRDRNRLYPRMGYSTCKNREPMP